jgi:hypothetical protein
MVTITNYPFDHPIKALQRLPNILGQIVDLPGFPGYGFGLLQVAHGLIDLGLDLVHSLADLDSAPSNRHSFTSFPVILPRGKDTLRFFEL